MPRVSEIAAVLEDVRVLGDGEVSVRGATHDSRQVRPGFLFAAMPGEKVDGGDFAARALEKGASAVLTGRDLGVPVPQIVVPDPRGVLGLVAAACYGNPTGELDLVGITGTNGKTTITYILEAALAAAGARPGVMGTVEYRFEDRTWKADHTTPEATVIQGVAREMADAGASHLVMEVSSHGLSLGRLNGCEFDVVAFTNLTQDHLDFHVGMEEYGLAKLRLFTEAIANRPKAVAVINIDDPFGPKVLRSVSHRALTVSCDPQSKADLRPTNNPGFGIDGVRTRLETPTGQVSLESGLLGPHNLNNILVALGVCLGLGIDATSAAAGMSALRSVPGRLERVTCDQGYAVLVDYAHTPDALIRVLAALRPLTRGRLLCVFGCGGDRDSQKRPLMGDAVGRGADLALVTSDNPRTEDPSKIVEMIVPGVEAGGLKRVGLEGMKAASRGYAVELDRAAAISAAVDAARDGDTILIAGKGHEDYQILGAKRIHFDDREQAAAAIRARGERG